MKRILQIAATLLVGAAAGAAVAVPISDSHHNSTTTVTQATNSPTVEGTTVSNRALAVNSIYRNDAPGVVDILVKQKVVSQSILGSSSQSEEDEGAGVVINKQGDIVTDEHVVGTAKTASITFADGKTATATVLGTDPSTDVAVLKVTTRSSELHPIAFDTSDNVEVGDPVVAIGSPFNLPETVTSGIVSQTGRSIISPNGYAIAGAVQTDAPINPGNSGGPLLNAVGDVIGLNDQIETENTTSTGEGSSSGVGFAIPAATVEKVASEIMAHKKVEHAYLGVSLSTLGSGATIESVTAGGPAAKAGLSKGDVVTMFDGRDIVSTEQLIAQVSVVNPGQEVQVTYTKRGVSHTTTVTMANQPPRQVTTS